jgi:hypothetical protein
MKYLQIAIVLLLTLFFSCKKDESKSNTDLLTQKGWVATSIKYNPSYPVTLNDGSTVFIADLFDVLNTCATDDLLQFYPTGNYTQFNRDICSNEPDVYLGNWTFNTKETKLYYGIVDYIFDYDIVSLTNSELILKTTITAGDSLSSQVYTETSTFKHE